MSQLRPNPASKITFFILFFTVFFSAFCHKRAEKPQNGDLIFQKSQSQTARAIQLATNSPYSHVGIIYIENGKYLVYEAVEPVKSTPLAEWIKRGEESHYVIKRLKDPNVLSQEVLQKMKKTGEKFRNRPYDNFFGWSDQRLYCSELVWKIYKRGAKIELAPLALLKEYNLEHPLVKSQLKSRYGKNIPLDEPVIAPSDLFKSALLKTVDILPEHLLTPLP